MQNAKELRRAVGKFVYPKGSDVLFHFMELKSFHVEESLDFAQLFYLRALRQQNAHSVQQYESVMRWMSRSSIKLVGEVIAQVAQTVSTDTTLILEAFPGIGVSFEYLKYLYQGGKLRALKGGKSDKTEPESFKYIAALPEEERHRFVVLHDQDLLETTSSKPFHFHLPTEPFNSMVPPMAAVFNSQYCIRHGRSESFENANQWLNRENAEYLIFASDAIVEAPGRKLTTIKGLEVYIPSVKEMRALLHSSPRPIFFRFFPGFDAEYFLPATGLEASKQLGLMIMLMPRDEKTVIPAEFSK